MASNAPDLNIGDRVSVMSKLLGTVRFKGETKFAPGEWFGVELDAAGQGKNDGTVQGVVYFACAPMQGIFVRRSALTLELAAATAPATQVAPIRPAAPAVSSTGTAAAQQQDEAHSQRSSSGANADSAQYPKHWKRRHSIDPDLDQAICIHGQEEMVEAIRSCSTEVQKLHGVVRRLSAALDDAAAREADALEAADAAHVPEPAAADLEMWLSEATARIERRIEERLGCSLEKQVVSAIASPIAELKAAAAELQARER